MISIFDTSKSILQELKTYSDNDINLFVKRDDLIHSYVSGNKWRKLKYSILQAQSKGKKGILTFGGAYSNHLLATASACNLLNMKSVGIVRGEELSKDSNIMLQKCAEEGMELYFVSRTDYAEKDDYDYLNSMKNEFPDYFIVPEGGANYYALIGCQEILNEVPKDFDHIFVAQGTTATSCGLLLGLNENTNLHVVPVLKGFDSLQEMKNLLERTIFDKELTDHLLKQVVVHDTFHFGGYAKYSEELLTFIENVKTEFQVQLDYVYTGKAFYAMNEELKKKEYQGKKILFIHTGGLHGNIKR
jgi:1-aminocyclopropane-1-carboxylate deaminase